MADKLPSYAQDNLALVGEMTSQIAAAAASDGVSVPFIPPDASFPLSPQGDFERRFGPWPTSSGGVLAGFNRAPQGQPDTPNNEDWSAMWRRRTGLR